MNSTLSLLRFLLLNGFLLGVPLLTLWTTRLATRSQYGGDYQLTRWLSRLAAIGWLLLPIVLFGSRVNLRSNSESLTPFWMVVAPLLGLAVLFVLIVWILFRAIDRLKLTSEDQRKLARRGAAVGSCLLIGVPFLLLVSSTIGWEWTEDDPSAEATLVPVIIVVSLMQSLGIWKLLNSLGRLESAPRRTRQWVAVFTYVGSFIVLAIITLVMGYPWVLVPVVFVLCMSFFNGYPARFEARQTLLLNTLQRVDGAPQQLTACLIASSEMLGSRLQQRFLPVLEGERFGTPVTYELAQAGVLSTQVRVPLEIAETTGTLRESLDLVKQLPMTLWPEDRSRVAATGMSLALTLLCLTAIAASLQWLTVPRLKYIWDNFQLTQPMDLVTSLATLLNIAVPVLVLWALVYQYQVSSPQSGGVLLTLERWFSVRPFVPGILSSLRSAVLGRQELSGVLSTLADEYRRTRVGPSLAQLDDAVRAGLPVWQEMSRLRLITPDEASALASAEQIGNLPNTLFLLADGRLARRRNAILRWFEYLRPAAYVVLALLIFWVQFSLFVSLISLIGAIS